jgi:small subunit ribosomal protein S1
MSDEINPTVAEATPTEIVENTPVTAQFTEDQPTEEQFAEAEDTDGQDASDDAAAAAEPASPQAETTSDTDEAGQPVVRMLSVGQSVTGVVKRVSEFGAFIDIGVGRDGLVHISELSARRVAKVTDVLQPGQEATFWIKKLDRERNRISLTMIEPGTKTIRNMEKGDVVQGTVTRIMPYGAFVDIGIGRDALLHVREMGERFVAKPEDVVQVGDAIDARIIDISRRRARVDLSIKGLRPEPEPEPTPEPEKPATPPPAQEPEAVDPYAEVEVLSPMEAAFRKAMEASGVTFTLRKDNSKKGKKSDNARVRAMQDDILARTLNSGGRK